MKGVRRILLNALTALSLVWCVAAVGVWVRSYWMADVVAWNRHERAVKVSTGSCIVEFWYLPGHLDFVPDGWSHESWVREPAEHIWGRGELSIRGEFKLVLPCWLIVLATGVLPAVRVVAHARRRMLARRRRVLGLCAGCGYDLRATPQGERCPECGRCT